MASSPSPQGRFRPSPATLALGAALLAANLAVAGMAWSSVRQGRRHAEEQARINSGNLARVLEQDLAGEIQAIDLALSAVGQEIGRELRAGGIRPAQLEGCIRETFALTPRLDALRTAGATGGIEHGIGVPPGSRISIRDRDYFRALRDDPSAGLVISKPALGRISGKRVVMLARRIETPAGGFGGVVYGVLTLDEFARGLALVDPGPRGAITLRDGDQALLARHPYAPGVSDNIGDTRISPASAALLRGGSTSGTYTARSALDHVERTFSFRKVGRHPLYLFVGLAPEDYLAQWRRESRRTWATSAAFGLLSVLLGALLHRAWRQDEERIQELSLALEEVRTLQDFLPICMYCKKVRDDRNYWSQIEHYITAHTGTRFSHGICPECLPKMLEEGRPEPGNPPPHRQGGRRLG